MTNRAKLWRGRIVFDCPGCENTHMVPVEGAHAWGWNGSLERPTLTPSLLTWAGEDERGARRDVCHSIVTDGRIQFLGDSHHALAGQTVDLPEQAE